MESSEELFELNTVSSDIEISSKLTTLEEGKVYWFREWPNRMVPQVCAGTYTIWNGDLLVYVGMSGRSLSEEQISAHRKSNSKNKGLFSRLNSHANGRRSGDQFCVYIADRLILPDLTSDQVAAISMGVLIFDKLVQEYIHEFLSFRFTETKDGITAYLFENMIRKGHLKVGKPLLNPL